MKNRFKDELDVDFIGGETLTKEQEQIIETYFAQQKLAKQQVEALKKAEKKSKSKKSAASVEAKDRVLANA